MSIPKEVQIKTSKPSAAMAPPQMSQTNYSGVITHQLSAMKLQRLQKLESLVTERLAPIDVDDVYSASITAS